MTKRVKFTKGRHVVGHGAFEPSDEIHFEDKLAAQLVAQDVAEYVEIAKPRRMVEKKAEVKTVKTFVDVKKLKFKDLREGVADLDGTD